MFTNTVNMYLIKTNGLGNELWNFAFGESFRDNASNLIIVDDGIIIAGSVEVRIVGSFEYSDIFLIKISIVTA